MELQINSKLITNHKVGDWLNMPSAVKVFGRFDGANATKFYEDCDKAINTGQQILPIYIDSFGGEVDSLHGMIDYFNMVRATGVEIITIAMGKAMSCGAMLFMLGDKRFVGQRSTVMIHRFSGGSWGSGDDIASTANDLLRAEKTLFEECSKHIGHKKQYLFNELTQRKFVDWFLNSNDCIEHNIATDVGIPRFTLQVSTNYGYTF